MEQEKKVDWSKIIIIIINAILAILGVIFGWNFNQDITQLKEQNKAIVQQYEGHVEALEKQLGFD